MASQAVGIAMLTPDGELSDDAFAGGGCGNYFDQLNNTNVHSSRGMALAHDGSRTSTAATISTTTARSTTAPSAS